MMLTKDQERWVPLAEKTFAKVRDYLAKGDEWKGNVYNVILEAFWQCEKETREQVAFVPTERLCDRCGKPIAEYAPPSGGMTVGYYVVDDPGPWSKYRHGSEERVVCDACMWADPAYQRDYRPVMR